MNRQHRFATALANANNTSTTTTTGIATTMLDNNSTTNNVAVASTSATTTRADNSTTNSNTTASCTTNAEQSVPGLTTSQLIEFQSLFYDALDKRYNSSTSKKKNGKPRFLSRDEYSTALNVVRTWRDDDDHSKKEEDTNKKYAYTQASHDSALRLRQATKEKHKGLKIAQKHNVFDIILRCHAKVAKHTRDPRAVYLLIVKEYYGIAEADVKLFISLCPICAASRVVITAKQTPLNMMLSASIGNRAIADLIDMGSSPDPITNDRWILRFVDHHSGYSQARPLARKTAELTSIAMIQICSCMPEYDIVQTDNGGEFGKETIKKLNEFNPSTHIVRGRPRHPQSQGAVERGNGPFKEALQKWMQEHPEDSWALRGIYIVSNGLNKKPSRNKDGYSAYEAFFGKLGKNSPRTVLDPHLISACQTEYGLQAALDLVKQDTPPSDEDILLAIREADSRFDAADQLGVVAEEDLGFERHGQLGAASTANNSMINADDSLESALTLASQIALRQGNNSEDVTAADVALETDNSNRKKDTESSDDEGSSVTVKAAGGSGNLKEAISEKDVESVESSGDESSTLWEDKCRETIQVNDKVAYYLSHMVAGDARAYRESIVIRVDPEDDEYPITLSSSDLISVDNKVKRLTGEMPMKKTTRKFRNLGKYLLEAGGTGKHSDGVMERAGRFSDNHTALRKQLAATGAGPMDMMVTFGGGTRATKKNSSPSESASRKRDHPSTPSMSTRGAKKRASKRNLTDAAEEELTPARYAIRQKISTAKKKQADQVNARRMRLAKLTLEEGDICNVVVEGNVRAATDFHQLPVVVVDIRTSETTSHTSYKVASRDGFIKGRFQRERLIHAPLLTATLMGIDITKAGFLDELDVSQASSLFNVLGGAKSCECTKGDCAKSGTCRCKKKGRFCTSKCHKGRGMNTKCTLVKPPPGSQDVCTPCEEETTAEA